jgi:hypothetical protein
MKHKLTYLILSLLVLCGCGREPRVAPAEQRLPAGHFISWNKARWVDWLNKAEFTQIQTKDDGLACDIMGSTVDNKRVIVNFFPDGRLKDLMFTHITLDLSATGKLATARSCLSIVDGLDPYLGDSFAEIADTDRNAAFLMNTRKYSWRNTSYVIGITTANKFWLEFNN